MIFETFSRLFLCILLCHTAVNEKANANICDYVREVIEEGLNLDVAGDPLLERLSLQCPPSGLLPGLVEMVVGLGLTRLAVHGMQGSGMGVPLLVGGMGSGGSGTSSGSGGGMKVLATGLMDKEVQAIVGSWKGRL